MTQVTAAASSPDPSTGLRTFVLDTSVPVEDWIRAAEQWRALGVSHLAVRTIKLGLRGADEHLERLALARDVLGDLFPRR